LTLNLVESWLLCLVTTLSLSKPAIDMQQVRLESISGTVMFRVRTQRPDVNLLAVIPSSKNILVVTFRLLLALKLHGLLVPWRQLMLALIIG